MDWKIRQCDIQQKAWRLPVDSHVPIQHCIWPDSPLLPAVEQLGKVWGTWGPGPGQPVNVEALLLVLQLKTESCHDANFVVTDSTAGCHNDSCGAIIDDNFFHHGDSRFSVTCLSLISLSFIARPRLIDWNPRLGRQCIEIFKRCDITSIYNGETKPSLDVSEVVIPKLASWRIQVFREPSHTVVPAQVWIIVIYVLE